MGKLSLGESGSGLSAPPPPWRPPAPHGATWRGLRVAAPLCLPRAGCTPGPPPTPARAPRDGAPGKALSQKPLLPGALPAPLLSSELPGNGSSPVAPPPSTQLDGLEAPRPRNRTASTRPDARGPSPGTSHPQASPWGPPLGSAAASAQGGPSSRPLRASCSGGDRPFSRSSRRG